jgi:hypothetical protein
MDPAAGGRLLPMPQPSPSKSTPHRVKPNTGRKPKDPNVVGRHIKAANLRAEGKNYRDIAEECGYADPKSAWHAVQSILKETMREAGRELITVELARYDYYLQRLAAQIQKGDVAAIHTALHISDRRTKLLGLEITKLELTSGDRSQGDTEQLRNRLLEKLAGLIPTTAESGDQTPGRA